jgi:hypothetical protein
MKTMAGVVAGVVVSLALGGGAVAQQKSGEVAAGPPEDIALEISLDDSGTATLSQAEFHLAWGGYYRFNIICPPDGLQNETAISFAAPDLWENSHLRIVSVADTSNRIKGGPEINVHVQGMQIRMLECEGLAQTARFSFYPVKKGTYPFTMENAATTPPQELKGTFIVE